VVIRLRLLLPLQAYVTRLHQHAALLWQHWGRLPREAMQKLSRASHLQQKEMSIGVCVPLHVEPYHELPSVEMKLRTGH